MDQRERVGNYEEAITTAIQGAQSEMWTTLPGIIESFDPTTMTCVVQCALTFSQRNAQGVISSVQMPALVDCPLVFMGGGQTVQTFTPAQGDECLLHFACRCIDEWWDLGGVQPQLELRLHDLSDGFVVCGPRSKPRVIQNISPNMQLRSIDGTVYLEIDPSGVIKIVAPNGVQITGPVNINDALQIDTHGNLTTQGNITAQGTMDAEGEGTFNGIPVSQHIHGGVAAGPTVTGAPQA